MLVDLSRVPERKHRRRCHASSSATEGFSGILEVYKVPKGIGALNTDKMCGVRVGNPHNSPPPGWPVGGLRGRRGRRGRSRVGWVWGGDWGNYTHKQTAYASHQRTNTLPPLEHSYFQAVAFPYRKEDAGLGWRALPVPKTHCELAYPPLLDVLHQFHFSLQVGFHWSRYAAAHSATRSEMRCKYKCVNGRYK